MKEKPKIQSNPQSGSILFYIFIAVALLAALSYAVSQGGSGNSTSVISEEKARAAATQIIGYSNSVANAVAKMRINGIAETSLCFDDAGWPAGTDYDHGGCSSDTNKIFDPDGGNISWKEPPADAIDAATDQYWIFTPANQVVGMGQTEADNASAELLMVLENIRDDVCIQINDMLGVSNPSDSPPEETQLPTDLFTGTFTYNAGSLGTNATELAGKKAACLYNDGGDYNVFYRVLLAR